MQETIPVKLENLFLALSDKTRLRLLSLMVDGEVSVGFLADQLGESQPKISRHLAYLRNADLVSARRDGKWIYYNIQKLADIAVERVLNAALFSITGINNSSETALQESFIDSDNNIYAETYESDWHPNEIEVYLL